MIGAVLAYRNEREDTHSPSIDTVTVGHGADQHSQLSMMILLQRSHTETIIGIEREKRERVGNCAILWWRRRRSAHTRTESIDDTLFGWWRRGVAMGRCGLREGRVCLWRPWRGREYSSTKVWNTQTQRKSESKSKFFLQFNGNQEEENTTFLFFLLRHEGKYWYCLLWPKKIFFNHDHFFLWWRVTDH